MSLTAEPAADASRSEEDRGQQPPVQRTCPRCGAELTDDQEWCLQCGTATTVIHQAPSLWVPIAVVALVVAVALAGFFFALDRVSKNPAPTTVSSAPARTASTSTNGLIEIGEWPTRLAGWTVVLAHTHVEAVAYAKATRLARAGVPAGVIYSSQHPGWIPGYWAVFSGRYLTRSAAKAAAATLVSAGHPGAHAKLVAR